METTLQKIDIFEDSLQTNSRDLLSILLSDHTTEKNIIWATDEYSENGVGYGAQDEIFLHEITREHGKLIRPRCKKSREAQKTRAKQKAEIFTPSWLCNSMNNLLDDEWFGVKDIFNIASHNQKTWKATTKPIPFPNPEGKTWKDYVFKNELEMTCGEAPFIVSRYDTTTGKKIPVKQRVGFLDRKMRVVNENTTSDEEWLTWTFNAFKASYGYDWQGDNVLIARENLLASFRDYYEVRFSKEAPLDLLLQIAEIISWNIFQMDGLKCVVPLSCTRTKKDQMSLFEEKTEECPGCKNNQIREHTGEYVKIMDWEENKPILFVSLLRDREVQHAKETKLQG